MTRKLLVGLLALTAVVCAQRRVDPRHTYNRIICVVPVIGKGTPEDPRRPQFAPVPGVNNGQGDSGIIAYSQVISDDGKYALVEFVARDRAAFQAILSDRQIKAFEKGKHKKDDIEHELKKFKKDFDLDAFGTVLP